MTETNHKKADALLKEIYLIKRNLEMLTQSNYSIGIAIIEKQKPVYWMDESITIKQSLDELIIKDQEITLQVKTREFKEL